MYGVLQKQHNIDTRRSEALRDSDSDCKDQEKDPLEEYHLSGAWEMNGSIAGGERIKACYKRNSTDVLAV